MGIEPEERQLIDELARGAVRSTAPQEAPLFRATSDAYFKDPEKTLRGQGVNEGMLGFGAGEVVQLITPVALALATETVRFLATELRKNLGEQSAAAVKDVIAALAGHIRTNALGLTATAAATAVATSPAAAVPPKGGALPFSREQLTEIRQRLIEKAGALNVSGSQAELLADALVGRLAIAT
jgi:hypothetical protein